MLMKTQYLNQCEITRLFTTYLGAHG